jgi:hypothetical protein
MATEISSRCAKRDRHRDGDEKYNCWAWNRGNEGRIAYGGRQKIAQNAWCLRRGRRNHGKVGEAKRLVFEAMLGADVPTELHVLPKWAWMRKTMPVTKWPDLLDQWMKTIGITSDDSLR